MIEEEADPGLGFAALHKHYALSNSYRIKEEPSDHDLLALQDLLSWLFQQKNKCILTFSYITLYFSLLRMWTQNNE